MCVVFLSKDKYLMSEMSVRHRDTRIAHTSIIKNEGSRMKDQGGGRGGAFECIEKGSSGIKNEELRKEDSKTQRLKVKGKEFEKLTETRRVSRKGINLIIIINYICCVCPEVLFWAQAVITPYLSLQSPLYPCLAHHH